MHDVTQRRNPGLASVFKPLQVRDNWKLHRGYLTVVPTVVLKPAASSWRAEFRYSHLGSNQECSLPLATVAGFYCVRRIARIDSVPCRRGEAIASIERP